jgi:glycosyltransferase involved in cell wall biosynthesis
MLEQQPSPSTPESDLPSLRVCIVADSASVKFGGEAILPYHYFRLLSRRGVETWLVVHDRTRPELDAALPEYRDRILYTPDLWLHKALLRVSASLPRRVSGSTLGLLSLLITQSYQKRLIRELVQQVGIDIIHQPVPVSPRMPSLICDLGAPVVIGPLNGGMNYPPAFTSEESSATHIIVAVARGLSGLVNRLLPGKLRAATILVANHRTRDALPPGVRGKILELVENAVDLETWMPAPAAPTSPPKFNQFLFLGRLVDWKRLDIVLHAMVKVPQATLLVVGDGAMRSAWEQLSRELQIADRVHFLGWQPQVDCARYLAQSRALVLPSIYECGGAVVLEAMASARPVIATRWGGPADYLDQSCGFLVEPAGQPEMIEQFASAMEMLLADPAMALRMGAAGQRRVQDHFNWQRKIDAIQKIYKEARERSPAAEPSPVHHSN